MRFCILVIFICIASLQVAAQQFTSKNDVIDSLNKKFSYCISYTADLVYHEHGTIKLKSIRILYDRIRIVQSEVFDRLIDYDDTISKEIYIPLRSIKKVSIVYDKYINQPEDGLLDILYTIDPSKKNHHTFLYFKWGAEKDMKTYILNAFNRLIELYQQ